MIADHIAEHDGVDRAVRDFNDRITSDLDRYIERETGDMKKKYSEIVFNGKYMCQKQCRGVQRYTSEVLHALDKIVSPGEVKVVIPHKVQYEERFDNIQVVRFGGHLTSKLWQMIGFQIYIWMNGSFSVCLSGGVPLFDMGIVAIHDVRYLSDLKKKLSLRAKIGMMFVKSTSARAVKRAKEIITVSEFSKQEIMKVYELKEDANIHVCYNSWQHLKKIKDENTFCKFSDRLQEKGFYFSLGGIEESKNMIWIMKMAQKYPERSFVIAGPDNLYFPGRDIDVIDQKNVIHLGYVSDEELKGLMANCKAFLFPSKYEGFGIPPMEAIYSGAKVFMSNAACLPEIYKDHVAYFDPYDHDVDLDDLLANYPDNSKDVLDLYSWDRTAYQILTLARQYL